MFDLNDPDTVKLLSDKHNCKLLKFLPESMQANREGDEDGHVITTQMYNMIHNI